MANAHTLKVRLLHDTVVRGASEPRAQDQLIGKAGEIHEFDKWTATHLMQCHPEFPRAELPDGKLWPKMQAEQESQKVGIRK